MQRARDPMIRFLRLAIVAIIAIVNGATASMKEQISGLGMRTITVMIFPNALSAASSARALTDELTSKFEALPDVSKAVPTSSSTATAIISCFRWLILRSFS